MFANVRLLFCCTLINLGLLGHSIFRVFTDVWSYAQFKCRPTRTNMCTVYDLRLGVRFSVKFHVSRHGFKFTSMPLFTPDVVASSKLYIRDQGMYVRLFDIRTVKVLAVNDKCLTVVAGNDIRHRLVFQFDTDRTPLTVIQMFWQAEILKLVDNNTLAFVMGKEKLDQINSFYHRYNRDRTAYFLNTAYVFTNRTTFESGVLLCCKLLRLDTETRFGTSQKKRIKKLRRLQLDIQSSRSA